MFRMGDTVMPWEGESLSGVVRRIEHDPEGVANVWCETPNGQFFMVAGADITPRMLTAHFLHNNVRTDDAQTAAAVGSRTAARA